MGRSGISWTICKQCAPHSRQITTPTPHQSIFTGRMLFLKSNKQCQTTGGKDNMHNNLVKIRPVIPDKCWRTDRQTDRQTHRNTALPHRGRSNNCRRRKMWKLNMFGVFVRFIRWHTSPKTRGPIYKIFYDNLTKVRPTIDLR